MAHPDRDTADDLLLRDLALISDGHRLTLWSTVHDRPVQPLHRNQIGHHLMPGLAAFLCVLGQAGTIPLGLWNWGPFDHAPFLPRVRYRDTILAPARWRLPDALVRTARVRTAWNTALTEWRATTRPAPPRVVVVDDTDRHLPLDLDHHDDRELLRRYVSRGITTVVEQPGGSESVRAVALGPDGHHSLEVVIPLTTNTEPERLTPPVHAHVRQSGAGLHAPGATATNDRVRDPVVPRPAPAGASAACDRLRRLGGASTNGADPQRISSALTRECGLGDGAYGSRKWWCQRCCSAIGSASSRTDRRTRQWSAPARW